MGRSHLPERLVTFDDADRTFAIDPAVTVVARPAYELGAAAADKPITRLRAPPAPAGRRPPTAILIRRASVERSRRA